MFEGIK